MNTRLTLEAVEAMIAERHREAEKDFAGGLRPRREAARRRRQRRGSRARTARS